MPQQYELNLRDYFRIFTKRRWIIASTVLILAIGSGIYFNRIPPIYKASTTVKILERKTVTNLLAELIAAPADIMESQTKIIRGFPIVKKAALRLGLIKDDFPAEKIQSVVNGLQGMIQTQKIENTNIIRIIVTAGEPKIAMDLANVLVDAYMEESLLEKTEQARTEYAFISEQSDQVENKLRAAEEKMRKFGEEAKNIRVAKTLREKLADLEFQLMSLLQKYTEKHPAVIQLKNEISNLEAQIKGLSKQELEYERLAREIEADKKLYIMLKEKLQEAQIDVAQKIGDVSLVDPAGRPSPQKPSVMMGTLTGSMMGLILGIVLAFVFETLDTSIGTIEDVESFIKLPVLGVVPSIEPSGELAKRRGVMGRIMGRYFSGQKTEKEETYIRLIVFHKPSSSMAEAYRNLRTNLMLIPPAKKSLMITSAGPREGKTTILTNLGLCVAQAGSKTLLVSSDLRRPALTRTFGIKREPGINEVLSGTASLDEAIKGISDFLLGDLQFDEILNTPGLENLWLLPAGHIPANPAELLESSEMANLIEELKKRFDILLFDSPPVLPVTDANLLAPKVNSVILCYEIGRTAREALLRAKTQLESVGGKISGIVLNHIAPQTESITAYPYYHRYKYKYYYGEKKEKEGPSEQKEA